MAAAEASQRKPQSWRNAARLLSQNRERTIERVLSAIAR